MIHWSFATGVYYNFPKQVICKFKVGMHSVFAIESFAGFRKLAVTNIRQYLLMCILQQGEELNEYKITDSG